MTNQTFDEKFMNEVMKRYQGYIEFRCKNTAENQIQDPAWGQEDLTQEILIHIWRFCTEASREYSDKDKIWLPHMEMIIRNVISNLIDCKYKRQDIIVDYSKVQEPNNIIEQNMENKPYLNVDMANLLVHVKANVKPEYQEYFDEIVNPSDKFRSFVKSNTTEGRGFRVTKALVAKYFKISYNKALAVFKDLEETFDSCDFVA